MNQLDLFSDPASDKFWQYHRENPQVYAEFCRITYQAIERGYKNWGAKGVFEILRWNTAVRARGEFKICNDYTPFYARLFMRDHPQHAGFFRVRESKCDKVL